MIALEAPKQWAETRLDAVAEIVRNIIDPTDIASGTTYVGLEHMESSGDFVGVGSVSNGELASAKFRFTPEHVLFGKLRPYLRKIARPGFAGVCSTDILPIKPKPSISRDYLFHYLRHPRITEEATLRCAGANLPRLSPSQLESFPVLVPFPDDPKRSLAEQKRIAAILDKADAIRRRRHEAARLTDQLIPSLFNDMFGDPVANARAWPTENLEKVAQLDRGRSRHRPRDEPSLYGGPYPLIQTGDIANSNGVITRFSQTYSERGLEQSKLWPAGTLCITIAANIANTAILTFDACFPDSVVGLVPGDRVTVDYVREWFVAIRRGLHEKAPQVAQKNINLAILNALDIPLPPKKLQDAFSERVREIRKLHDEHSRMQREGEDLFNSLVQRAFRGEL